MAFITKCEIPRYIGSSAFLLKNMVLMEFHYLACKVGYRFKARVRGQIYGYDAVSSECYFHLRN